MSCGRPLWVGTLTGSSVPDRGVMRSVSMSALSTKALPVCRWQSRQWQQCTNMGADLRRKRTTPQAQPPSRASVAGTPLPAVAIVKPGAGAIEPPVGPGVVLGQLAEIVGVHRPSPEGAVPARRSRTPEGLRGLV